MWPQFLWPCMQYSDFFGMISSFPSDSGFILQESLSLRSKTDAGQQSLSVFQFILDVLDWIEVRALCRSQEVLSQQYAKTLWPFMWRHFHVETIKCHPPTEVEENYGLKYLHVFIIVSLLFLLHPVQLSQDDKVFPQWKEGNFSPG